ncbi:MAG: hypothetical protein KBB78_01780 [Candidatus Pacebacteria bacterium]|nr:hypothetical protein [Candidatus Paceibacterota bacterium]MBP6924275.1 hypothetical protein [Candidatus Paceibacterota bacterium]
MKGMPAFLTPLMLIVGIFTAMSFLPISLFDVRYDKEAMAVHGEKKSETKEAETPVEKGPDTREVVKHVPLPEQVKAIYMTSCVAGTTDFRQRLVKFAQETEVNSMVIDIKDYSGTISFPPQSDAWKPAWANARCGTADMGALVQMLHDNNVYTIARVTVFQDPFYAPKHPAQAVQRSDRQTVWTDHKGLSFVDVASKEYWDHIIELSTEAYNLGFDEINFDYVRYPSDGNMADVYFPQSMAGEYGGDKQANLEAFFRYLNEKLDEESRFAKYRHENTGRASSTPYTSADLFGMTTTNYDDLSIGQVQDRTAPYFDFVAPMVYPSHYPKSFLGLGNPNDYPYKVVYHAMKTGVDRMKSPTTPMQGFLHERVGTSTPTLYKKPTYDGDRFRTWIQDFDYGGDYDAADVRAQIQASYDAGVKSWMVWAPSNIYTRGAFEGPE